MRKIAKGMITMCTVYEFPVKKKFPKELEERLNKVSEEYVSIMAEALEILYDGNPTQEDYDEYMELMLNSYLEAFVKAVENLE